VSQFALLALRSYFGMHLLVAGQSLQKKTKRKLKPKYMDLHRLESNADILDLFSKNMNTLVSYLQRTSWKPAFEFIAAGGIVLVLELIIVSSYWNATQVAHYALEVLQLVTLAPFTHLPLSEEKLDNGRIGIGVILETAAVTNSNNGLYIMITALQIILNIIYLPDAIHQSSGVIQSRRRIYELMRTNDSLRILIDILRYATPTQANKVRALACRALLGLSQDATVNQILRKMDVSEVISDLLKQHDIDHSEDFENFQEYALQLLGRTTGRESKTISMEARDHTLVRLEKAAIVANTTIHYDDNELMQVIHEFLNSRGMKKTAESLLSEAVCTDHYMNILIANTIHRKLILSKLKRKLSNLLRHQDLTRL
jgi:HIV-1 Vpr-binding protein